MLITLTVEVDMVIEVSADEFRRDFDEMLDQVQHRNNSVVITKEGKPVAALVDAASFERIRRMESRFDELTAKIAEGFAGIPEEEGIAEIDRIVYEERHRRALANSGDEGWHRKTQR